MPTSLIRECTEDRFSNNLSKIVHRDDQSYHCHSNSDLLCVDRKINVNDVGTE